MDTALAENNFHLQALLWSDFGMNMQRTACL